MNTYNHCKQWPFYSDTRMLFNANNKDGAEADVHEFHTPVFHVQLANELLVLINNYGYKVPGVAVLGIIQGGKEKEPDVLSPTNLLKKEI